LTDPCLPFNISTFFLYFYISAEAVDEHRAERGKDKGKSGGPRRTALDTLLVPVARNS
jgi:hypothetical protein